MLGWIARLAQRIRNVIDGIATKYGRWALFLAGSAVIVAVGLVVGSISAVSLAPRGTSDPSDVSQLAPMADLLWTVLALSAIVGLLSAAFVEVFKNVTTVRGWFHRNELAKYFSETSGGEDEQDEVGNAPEPDDADPSEEPSERTSIKDIKQAYLQGVAERERRQRNRDPFDLLEQALGRDTLTQYYDEAESFFGARRSRDIRYIFNLPLEQLAAQLLAALDVALSEPATYSNLLEVFVGDDVGYEDWVAIQELTAPDLDAGEEKGHSPSRGEGPGPAEASPEPSEATRTAVVTVEEEQRLYRIRSWASQRIQRGVEILQIIIGHRWRWFIRVLALAVAAPIAMLAAEFSGTTGAAFAVSVLATTIIGGFFAWTLRDIFAVVERWRS